MAAIYKSEKYDLTVGITDVNRCNDNSRINRMFQFLRDDLECDLIILSSIE